MSREDFKCKKAFVCFYVDRRFRRKGLSVELIRAAVDHARSHGAKIVEAYPLEPKKKKNAELAWTGFASAFARAGFKEVARRSRKRPIMRYCL